MDINEAVAQLIAKCKELLATESVPEGQIDQEYLYALALEVAQSVVDIDTWLMRGGAIPLRWDLLEQERLEKKHPRNNC